MSADYVPDGDMTLLYPRCHRGRNVQDNITIQVHFSLGQAAQTDCENTVLAGPFECPYHIGGSATRAYR